MSRDKVDVAARELRVLRESFRYLEHAPAGIVVVHGDAHTVIYANAAFRASSTLHDSAILARPIVDVLEDHPATTRCTPPCEELIELLDRVRNERAREHGVNVNMEVSERVSASASIGEDTSAAGGDYGLWMFKVWPVELGGVWIDQLIVELWHAGAGEFALLRQREIAERMLVSALRERSLSDDNARLYEEANAARAVAEDAQLHAEQAQHQAEAANATKAQFLANMSHELRTPLNAISGYAQLMELGLRGAVTDAQKADLQRIQRSQAHLLGLINDVLNYAKLEAGKIAYAVENVSLSHCVIEAEGLVNPQLRAKGLEYRYAERRGGSDAPRATPVRVMADPEKLRQILLNLFTNAVKFTAPGGSIWVECRTGEGNAYVDVRDTGRGIPFDKLQSIFEPFVQVGRTLTSGDSGVGLGLAISRELAAGMSGDLTVESVEGEGSTFTLTLPLAAA